jgi:hypothetical protein
MHEEFCRRSRIFERLVFRPLRDSISLTTRGKSIFAASWKHCLGHHAGAQNRYARHEESCAQKFHPQERRGEIDVVPYEHGAFQVPHEFTQDFAETRRSLEVFGGKSMNVRCTGITLGIDQSDEFRQDGACCIESHDGDLDDAIRFPSQSCGLDVDHGKPRRETVD